MIGVANAVKMDKWEVGPIGPSLFIIRSVVSIRFKIDKC